MSPKEFLGFVKQELDSKKEFEWWNLLEGLEKAGVKIGLRDGRPFRAVTHRMVSSSDIDGALTRIEAGCRRLRRRAQK